MEQIKKSSLLRCPEMDEAFMAFHKAWVAAAKDCEGKYGKPSVTLSTINNLTVLISSIYQEHAPHACIEIAHNVIEMHAVQGKYGGKGVFVAGIVNDD